MCVTIVMADPVHFIKNRIRLENRDFLKIMKSNYTWLKKIRHKSSLVTPFNGVKRFFKFDIFFDLPAEQ